MQKYVNFLTEFVFCGKNLHFYEVSKKSENVFPHDGNSKKNIVENAISINENLFKNFHPYFILSYLRLVELPV